MSELPHGLGRFCFGAIEFVVDDGLTHVSLASSKSVDEQSLDTYFGIDKPLASWLLARVKFLAAGSLELDDTQVEVAEGGVYVIDFVVRKDGVPAGKVQLQAGRVGAALLGVVSPDLDVVSAFVSALAEDPDAVAPCRVLVRDPTWPEGEITEYGWDLGIFAGS